MGKIILIFTALLVVAIGVVSSNDGEEDMDEEFFEELEEVLAKFCSTVLTDDSEEVENEMHSDEKHYDDYDRRKKRDLSSHGFDAEVLATKDPGTLIGYGLGLACVGLQRAQAEAARDAEELNRRKRQVHETVRHFGFGKV